MGPLNALCRPIFQRRNLTPILFCKHTHRRDTFALRILAAHPRTTLSNLPKFLVESNFANTSCSQFLSPTDYCLPPHRPEAGWSEAELAARCRYYHLLSDSGTSGQPALTFSAFCKKKKTEKDDIIYYQPQEDPAELSQHFSTFCHREFAHNSYFYTCYRSIFRPSLSFPHGRITSRQTKIQTYSNCKQQPALCAQLFLLPEIKSLYGSVKMPQIWGILPPHTPAMQHQQCQPGG